MSTRAPSWERRAARRQAELDARPADTPRGRTPRADWSALVLGVVAVLVVLGVGYPVSMSLCAAGVTCPAAVASDLTAPGGVS